jgi:hypothetical protein
MPTIASVVEGYGELEAFPILVRGIAAEARPSRYATVLTPIRLPRSKIVKPVELARMIELAARKINRTGAIVVLLDSDGDAPCVLGPQLLRQAQLTAAEVPVRVVVAHCEWEAWYLAAASYLSGLRGLSNPLVPPPNPENIRDAKGGLGET